MTNIYKNIYLRREEEVLYNIRKMWMKQWRHQPYQR